MPHKDTAARRAYLRDYKRKHRDRLRMPNADSDRARHANRRAALYGAPGRITITDARAVMAAGACFYCGGNRLLGIDHVMPLHAGGVNERSNIVACCRACNSSKWRQDAPYRWSRMYEACRRCGTDERRHVAKGLCNACYLATRKPQDH